MKTQLETEMEDDKEVYEKLVCWCETGTKEKTKAIEEVYEKLVCWCETGTKEKTK